MNKFFFIMNVMPMCHKKRLNVYPYIVQENKFNLSVNELKKLMFMWNEDKKKKCSCTNNICNGSNVPSKKMP